MDNEPDDSQILSQERWNIELLARETNTAVATVEGVFLVEYKRLAAAAHIKSYLPLLTSNCVREILEMANAARGSGVQTEQV